ncbi:MAG: insulinase family protein [Sphingomonadales bacterium]|nr:insulinase family protein [Sphingomonadales bacterium]
MSGLFPVEAILSPFADRFHGRPQATSISDVRSWFADNYGPNNVVLALTGDIDLPTARTAVERWFGDIPLGRMWFSSPPRQLLSPRRFARR